MPRRHKSTIRRQPPLLSSRESSKVAYASKRAAEAAIREHAKYNLEVTLRAYQSPQDGKWRLTSIESGTSR